MLEQFHYDSDLIGGSLMVRESRLIADLLLREATPEQWHQAIQIDNILQNVFGRAHRYLRHHRRFDLRAAQSAYSISVGRPSFDKLRMSVALQRTWPSQSTHPLNPKRQHSA